MGATPEQGPQPRHERGATPAQPPLLSIAQGSSVHGVELALEGLDVGIFQWDARSGAYQFSEKCRCIWGFDSHAPMTLPRMLARVHPKDRVAALRMLSAGLSGARRQCSGELRIVLPSGTMRWVQIAATTQRGGDGALRGYGAMHEDTGRKLTVHKLQEQRSQLRAFVECSPAPIAMLDSSQRYVAVSQRYAADRELDAAAVVGKTISEVFPDMPALWYDRYQRTLAGTPLSGETESVRWMRRRVSKRERLRWEMCPWYNADQRVGGVIVFAELLTRSLEEQELRDSQARLELAIHAGELGVFDFDYDTQEGTVDERVHQILEMPPGQKVISFAEFLQQVHPEDRERVSCAAQTAVAVGGGHYKEEYRYVPNSGGPLRWLAASGQVICDDGHCRLVGILKDITRRKRTELSLQESAEELRGIDERKNIYLATLSHELRSPLMPISTAAHLLDSPKLSGEQLQWVAQVINRQTAQMTALLDDLLDITRISRGKLKLRKTRVALTDITRSALETTQPLIDARGHRLLVTLPDAPLMIYADPLRLAQVLSNLLTNAVKYTAAGGQIELTAAVEAENLVIRVRDNGIGIPRESLSKIFTMFWQDNSAAQRGGLGIGLAFAQAIVRLHGGTLEARSDGPGEGTEVSVRLALKNAAPHDGAARRVLAASSDRATAEALRTLLNGHELWLATSSEEVLAAAREHKPDVVLLDLTLPGMEGVSRLLRQEPWAQELRLIALLDIGDKPREGGADYNEQLFKPIDTDRLRSLLGLPLK